MDNGFEEIGAIEIDVARHLDARISIHVRRVNEQKTGRVEVSID
jgi:hypothetical protein